MYVAKEAYRALLKEAYRALLKEAYRALFPYEQVSFIACTCLRTVGCQHGRMCALYVCLICFPSVYALSAG
jgi:hypothetical protein